MFRITPTVRSLLILNVLVFVLQMLSDNVITGYLALWNLNSSFFKPYQFFTYMFLHGDFWHIGFNMYALFIFGPILETQWGDKKFLLFYMITGIGAGIVYGVVNFFMGGGGPMIGASGALYGLMMAFGLIFPNLEIMLLFPPIPIKAKYMVFIFGGLAFLLDRSGQVAHVAHFGGAIVGYILVNLWKNR